MTYQITIESPNHETVTFARKGRDAAEFLFRRSVYTVLKAHAC